MALSLVAVGQKAAASTINAIINQINSFSPSTTRGYTNVATSASGQVVVTHGLGSTPTSVAITGGTAGTLPGQRIFTAPAASLNSTTFTVTVYRLDTPGTLNSNPVDFYWEALA